jgi:alkylhydroperoxidase family enzyme
MIAPTNDTGAPRLGPLAPPYDPEVQRTLERLTGGTGVEPLLLFRTLAHNPALLEKLRSTGTYLLNFGTIEPLEREIVILRTCARCGCEYEWGVHVAIYSSAVGLTEAQVRATRVDDGTAWTRRQQLLIALVDELHETSSVSDELWAELASGWRPDQLIELVTLVGQYHTVSFTARALRIEREGFAARFPG